MNRTITIPHAKGVQQDGICAQFVANRAHRASLFIPFTGTRGSRTLCVIGQNPSAADENNADKTVRYLEDLIYLTRPEFNSLIVLNLYSRIDTKKQEKTGLLHPRCKEVFDSEIDKHQDILLVWGKLKNEGAYKFRDRAREVQGQISSKLVLKLDLGTPYPPHPGNPLILYNDLAVPLAEHTW